MKLTNHSMPRDLVDFLERMTRNTAFLAGGVALLFFVRARWSMAYSIVAAAAIFTWSLRWQAEALSALLSQAGSAHAEQRDDARARPSPPKLGASMFLRVPMLLLALAALLWYTPANPVGVIYGVGCVLVGAISAALTQPPSGLSQTYDPPDLNLEPDLHPDARFEPADTQPDSQVKSQDDKSSKSAPAKDASKPKPNSEQD